MVLLHPAIALGTNGYLLHNILHGRVGCDLPFYRDDSGRGEPHDWASTFSRLKIAFNRDFPFRNFHLRASWLLHVPAESSPIRQLIHPTDDFLSSD